MSKVMSLLVKEALKDELTAIVKPLEDKVQCLSKENVELRLDNSNLKKEVKSLLLKTNANEQYSRKDNIRIAGIEEEPEEDCYKKVSIFLQSKLGLAINDSDFDRIHRIGKPWSGTRHMIVKFKSYRAKAEVLKHRRKLKGTKGAFINEDLTAFNLELYRQARETDHIVTSWVSDGKTFVKQHDETIHVVRCIEDIHDLKPCRRRSS